MCLFVINLPDALDEAHFIFLVDGVLVLLTDLFPETIIEYFWEGSGHIKVLHLA